MRFAVDGAFVAILALCWAFAGTFVLIFLGCHFGGKWVDRMLHYDPTPINPNKPIVLPHWQDRHPAPKRI